MQDNPCTKSTPRSPLIEYPLLDSRSRNAFVCREVVDDGLEIGQFVNQGVLLAERKCFDDLGRLLDQLVAKKTVDVLARCDSGLQLPALLRC